MVRKITSLGKGPCKGIRGSLAAFYCSFVAAPKSRCQLVNAADNCNAGYRYRGRSQGTQDPLGRGLDSDHSIGKTGPSKSDSSTGSFKRELWRGNEEGQVTEGKGGQRQRRKGGRVSRRSALGGLVPLCFGIHSCLDLSSGLSS
jgi:hypothetical protein